MVARIQVDPELLWATYQKVGSLRGAARELGLGHMVVRSHLERAGYQLNERRANPQSLKPQDKIYVRPAQIEAIDQLAAQKGVSSRHEMARILLDDALKRELKEYAAS